MKLRKKVVYGRCLLLSMIYLVVTACPANADSLPLASSPRFREQFVHHVGYSLDQETNQWRVYNQYAAQVLQTIETGDVDTYLSKGVCAMYLQIVGCEKTGLAAPSLVVLLANRSGFLADSLTFVIGTYRYDFVASVASVQLGSAKCTQFTLLLDAKGMLFLDALVSGMPIHISINSDSQQYVTSIQEKPTYTSAREEFEAYSIVGIRDMLQSMRDAGMEAYRLWDMNEIHWKGQMETRLDIVAMQDDPVLTESQWFDETFATIARESTQTAISGVQKALQVMGFRKEDPDGRYTKELRASIMDAQRYFGLLPTGQADKRLLLLLQNEKKASTQEIVPNIQTTQVNKGTFVEAEPSVTYLLDGVGSIRMDRKWFAKEIYLSAIEKNSEVYLPLNDDHAMLIADGLLQSLCGDTISCHQLVNARFVVDGGYEYPCMVRCIVNQGTALGSDILPLEEVHIVVFAEVPLSFLDLNNIRLEITVGINNPTIFMY